MLAATDGTFTVGPSLGLILWTIYIWAVLGAAVVTGLKGRWMWLLVGLLLAGLPLFGAAFLPAEPDSTWARRALRRRSQTT